ncbi:MAG: valine--tRNA ligase, partial [Rickettsiales bacterium]|nr:valine--tRNA ligase [Rickettsiales bacterium]
YPIGWDDNGLPTERRVQINYNIKVDPSLPYIPNFKPALKFDEPMELVSRQNFIETCQEMVAKDSAIFESIFRRVGYSIDWALKYSTIGKKAMKVAQESFINMYNDGHLKLVDAPTMWDTQFQTAVAQAEIEDKEIAGHFHDIRFKCGSDEFVISTTRPELLPAIIAIVAHPDDARYKKFFGKNATAPLFNIEIPIMPSLHANPEKGTGIMMVCTFGDQEDVAFWKTHKLPLKQIIGRDGRIFGAPGLDGLSVKQARKKIVEMLRESGDLVGEPKPIVHAVKFYEKGDLPIEFIPSRQWFVSLLDKKEKILSMNDQIKWTPEHMGLRMKNWTEGLNQDWCISRQRFFGEPFPVWYKLDAAGEPIYDEPIIAKNLPCDPAVEVPAGFSESQRGQPNGFMAEPDIMDTWATSSRTPEIAMACIEGPHNMAGHPFDARPNAHDIIRTWDFYTIAQSLMNDGGMIPWKQLWISGFVLDPDRKKMSKSRGNIVTPADWIEKYGSDAVRLWAASFKFGTDAIADEKIMEQKRKLVMKFFNAAKFVIGLVVEKQEIINQDFKSLDKNLVDLSYMARLGAAVSEADKYFRQNDHTGALIATEQAFWDFCDNYLEIVKGRAYAGDQSALCALHYAMKVFDYMFAPFMPFITEEVWQTLLPVKTIARLGETAGDTRDIKSVHQGDYPSLWKDFDTSGDAAGYDKLRELVSFVRGKKSENNFSMKKGISRLTLKSDGFLSKAETDIKNVLNVSELEFKIGMDSEPKIIWSEEV